ncbi:MAG: hypothetical protein R3C14_16770 [Caldilineaceae bacterium]
MQGARQQRATNIAQHFGEVTQVTTGEVVSAVDQRVGQRVLKGQFLRVAAQAVAQPVTQTDRLRQGAKDSLGDGWDQEG